LIPNKSQDLLLKKSPFEKMPSFLSTYSRFFGSLMTTPGGRLGTEIWNVSKPNGWLSSQISQHLILDVDKSSKYDMNISIKLGKGNADV